MEIEELGQTAAEEIGLFLSRTLIYDECSVDLVRTALLEHPFARQRYSLGLREDGRLVALAIATEQERWTEGQPPAAGHIQVVATDPAYRRRGYATQLLDELERRFADDGLTEARVEGDFWAGIDVRYTPALCLFLRRGYTRERDIFNLEVDLRDRDFSTDGDERRLAAEGITVRRVVPDDYEALDRYMLQTWGPRWRREVMSAFSHDPISCHIALQGERIVAFAANDTARPGWFGPTGTDEEMRGRGIGAVLLKRCMQDWQRDGRKSGEINWIGPLYFYTTAVGARVSRVFWQMRKPLIHT